MPALNTSSLPDLIFTLLFFFMIVTTMREKLGAKFNDLAYNAYGKRFNIVVTVSFNLVRRIRRKEIYSSVEFLHFFNRCFVAVYKYNRNLAALDLSLIHISRGELQIIGATTIEEYRKHIEKDAALERRCLLYTSRCV